MLTVTHCSERVLILYNALGISCHSNDYRQILSMMCTILTIITLLKMGVAYYACDLVSVSVSQ